MRFTILYKQLEKTTKALLFSHHAIIFATFFSVTSATYAASNKESASRGVTDINTQKLLRKMEWQIQSTLKEITKHQKVQGNSISDIYYTIEVPAKSSVPLGVIVDPSEPTNGLSVLSVTPDSLASKLNIKANDRILKINEKDVDATNIQSSIEKLNTLENGEELELEIASNDSVRTTKVLIKSEYIPGFRIEIGDSRASKQTSYPSELPETPPATIGCGRVSVFFTPPETKRLYSASFSAIDGEGVLRQKATFILPAGKHIIKLHELIPQSSERFKRTSGIMRAKEIEVNVEPDTTYHLASRFIPSKRFKSFKEEYWEPTVWKKQSQKCEL